MESDMWTGVSSIRQRLMFYKENYDEKLQLIPNYAFISKINDNNHKYNKQNGIISFNKKSNYIIGQLNFMS
jgi:Na+-transporting NADH:ubiquinone oxidoreductase subunit NqrF